MICYGPHASDIVGRHLIIVVALGIVPSWIIGDLVYWKQNRYLKYYAAFETLFLISLGFTNRINPLSLYKREPKRM